MVRSGARTSSRRSTCPGGPFRHSSRRAATGGTSAGYRHGRGVGGSSAVNAMLALHGDDALYRSWGWDDAAAAWAAIELPEEHVEHSELGAVDRALLGSGAGCGARPTDPTRWPARHLRRGVAVAGARPGEPRSPRRLAGRPRRVRGSPCDRRAARRRRRRVGRPSGARRRGDPLTGDPVAFGGRHPGRRHRPAGPSLGAADVAAARRRGRYARRSRDRRIAPTRPLAVLADEPSRRRRPWTRIVDDGADAAAGSSRQRCVWRRTIRRSIRSSTSRCWTIPATPPRSSQACRVALELLEAPSFREIVEEVYIDAFGTTDRVIARRRVDRAVGA